MITNLALAFRAAQDGAIGSFNVLDLDMGAAVVEAAEHARRPVVLGIASRHFDAIRAPLLAPALRRLAEQSSQPVALHLDHAGPTEQRIVQAALDLGFTSIMIDGSRCCLEDNIDVSRRTVEQAHPYGASVEGELGGIGGSEGVADTKDSPLPRLPYTDATEALRYVHESGVDALAIAIGTAHGIYAAAPEIDFATIKRVRAVVPVPLVLHGSTGVRPVDIRRCVSCGIRKINFFSGLLAVAMDRARHDAAMLRYDFLELKQRFAADWRALALEQIELFSGRRHTPDGEPDCTNSSLSAP